MRAIAPRMMGVEETTFGEDQAEYCPITIAICRAEDHPGATVLFSRWTFTAEERERIAAGEDVYIGQLNFGTPMTPLLVTCGAPDLAPSPEP